MAYRKGLTFPLAPIVHEQPDPDWHTLFQADPMPEHVHHSSLLDLRNLLSFSRRASRERLALMLPAPTHLAGSRPPVPRP